MMATLPFLVPLVVVLLLVTFIPAISMWLPTLVYR
jgi:TRAP-type C4-dicarboxylate transport system permease large subunit